MDTTSHHPDVLSRSTSAIQAVAVVLVIALPQIVLAALGDRIPPAFGRAVSLLSLPLAAVLAGWLVRREPGRLGLRRPASWPRTLGLGILAGVTVLVIAMFVITPLLERFFGRWLVPEMFDPLKGDVRALVVNVLLISWLHAALCEEVVFRGFLLQRLETALGETPASLLAGVGVSSALFGLAHYPQGLPGILATTIGGLLWATAYLRTGRNLWVVIIGHATMDTILFVFVFLGQHRLLLPG